MDRSKRKLIRQLEQLQAQIDKLKQDYLSSNTVRHPVNPKVETSGETVSLPNPADDALQGKRQRLLEQVLSSGKENEFYKKISKKIRALTESGKTSFPLSDIQEIQQTMEQLHRKTDNWEIFRQKFSALYKDFFDKLVAAHPDLTKTEIKFCAYLRLHMSSQQIASVMDISMEAIRKNRYRTRKKLRLKTEDSLEEYIEAV